MYLLWLRIAALLYAAASIAVFPAVFFGVPRWRKLCVHLAGMAFFFHLVSCVEMLVQAHRWMPVGVREVESLLGLAVVSVFLVVWWLYDAIPFGIFALPVTFFAVFVPALGPDRYTFPSEGVRLGWLVAHIATLLYLVQERRLKRKCKPAEGSSHDWLPPLDTLERVARATLEFGLPCMTVGLVIGSVLAQEVFGPAYFFDPKVIASFVLWVVYVALLLVRRSAGLRGKKAAWLSGVVFLVMLGVLAANLFSHVHRYGPQ
jgi:ABC-type uncharacterized transport system permease subunit